MGNIVLGAQTLQPVRTPAAGGHHGMLRQNLLLRLPVGNGNALAHVVLQNDVGALIAKQDFHPMLLQIPLDGKIQALGLLRAEVPDGAVHQLQPRLNGVLADFLALKVVAKSLDMLVRAEIQINLVGVVDCLLGQVLSHQRGKIAAHLIGKRQLSVGKGPRAGKSGGNVAIGLAVHAIARFVLGTVALFHALALLHHHNFLFTALFEHLQRGKNTGRARAHNHNVCVHRFSPYFPGWRLLLS
ncbi:hypothetical protein SDC9_62245 [bioreactor metagenome]|uniref:Uncharacterized protein n=1 Tax=bioreactor metagenome TaxID=1076179 RepID=A0A644XJA0_9ZZZZ